MRITAKADYAVRAAAELAAAADDGVLVKGEQLARSQSIPQNFLENILTELRRAGIVRTRRGAEGGYQLARPAAVIATKRWLREEYNYRLQVDRTNPNFSNDFKQEKIRARARPLHEQNIRDAW